MRIAVQVLRAGPLPGDLRQLTGFDEFLEAAVGKKALPLHHGFLGIEVVEGEQLERVSRPGPKNQSC